MPIREITLNDRSQTGESMYRMAEHWKDLGTLADKSFDEFFEFVKNIPYKEDGEKEVTARPKFLLDTSMFPFLDCKKKAVLIGAWLNANKYIPSEDWRFVAVAENEEEEIEHVFSQVKINDKWHNFDATYFNMEQSEPKPEATKAEELLPMTNLVEMSGIDNLERLLSMPVEEFGDIEAGIWFLKVVGEMYPDMTMKELFRGQVPPPIRMAGWLTDFKKSIGKITGGIGDVIGGVGDKVGEWIGGAVRLVTDEQVIDAGGRAMGAYTTGGMSESFGGFGTNGGGYSMEDILGVFGSVFKSEIGTEKRPLTAGSIPMLAVYGIGALLLIGLVVRK